MPPSSAIILAADCFCLVSYISSDSSSDSHFSEVYLDCLVTALESLLDMVYCLVTALESLLDMVYCLVTALESLLDMLYCRVSALDQ